MKTLYTLALVLLSATSFATSFSIAPTGSFTFSPDSITIHIGDTVFIAASSMHPPVQVDSATWAAGGNTPLSGGWGVKTSDFIFIGNTVGTVYYVCNVHHASGMKGRIRVAAVPTSIPEIKDADFTIAVFPNPSFNKQLTVSIPGVNFAPCSIEFFNDLGQLVGAIELTNSTTTVPVNYPAGSYTYQIHNPSKGWRKSGRIAL